jgi:predicted O-methyltransferase YrrM
MSHTTESERERLDGVGARTSEFLRRSVQHPTWAIENLRNSLYRRLERSREGWTYEGIDLSEALARVTGAPVQDIQTLMDQAPEPRPPAGSTLFGMPDGSKALVKLLYATVRVLRPTRVLETGVAHGFSTTAILTALRDNGHGHLDSVDLPHLQRGAERHIGGAVPADVRDRWTLHLGPGDRTMKRVLKGTPPLDLFIQDSAHTRLGQLAEYRVGWGHLKPGGLMISDDCGPSFDEFAAKVGSTALYVVQPPKRDPIGLMQR